MRISDWSSDVCSSDLPSPAATPSHLSRRQCQMALRSVRPEQALRGHSPHAPLWARRYPKCSDSAALPCHRGRLEQHPNQPSPARSEEHTSELQSLMRISYAVFCLKKKTT